MARTSLRIGFIPLLDCAPLVAAREKGFFAAEGLAVEMRKAQGWGQAKAWLMGGVVDAAQMLITIPIQCSLGLETPRVRVDFAFTMNRRGNGIILSNALWNAGARDARGLAGWLEAHPQAILRLGVVHPRGTQEYFLRHWLADAGLVLGERISLAVISPQEMVGRLRKGEVDGFCVAEPWSRRAAASKLGRLVAESGALLPGTGDKVLAVRDAWHLEHGGTHARCLRALARAAAWLADPANAAEAAALVASKRYVNAPQSVVEAAMAEERAAPRGGDPHRPLRGDVLWYLEQMFRWNHLRPTMPGVEGLHRICLEEYHARALSGAA